MRWALLLTACVAPKPYHCTQNLQCIDGETQGICEPDGSCSFPDDGCPSNQRYGSAGAPDVAGRCTPLHTSCIVEILGGGTTEDSLDVGHTCARKSNGTVWCWGDNSFGQLGSNAGASSSTPVQVPLPSPAMQLASGELFACALLVGGDVYCWGDNEIGQLGVGDSPMTSSSPLRVAAAPAKTIGAGGGHACLIDTTGKASCWGENGDNQIGSGATDPQTTPFEVPGLGKSDAIGAGDQHSCAILDDTSVHCWGSNALGQLGQGDGSAAGSADPVQVKGLASAAVIRLGDQHTCALLTDTSLLCWGTNVAGTVGNGSTENANSPVQILDSVAAVATSGDAKHTCVSKKDGTLFCWGNNDTGQVGRDPAAQVKISTPVQLPLSSVKLVAAGAHHSCATTADGALWCWGSNHSGQLGLAVTEATTPTRVPFSCE